VTTEPALFHDSLRRVLDALDAVRVDYFVTGSLASAAHGVARATADADIVVDLDMSQYEALVDRLGADFYVPDSFARQAIVDRGMFNIIRIGALFKADLILLRRTEFDAKAMLRARASRSEVSYPTATAEDIILFKLQWLIDQEPHSDRQLSDIAGVIATQRRVLDLDYLRTQAKALGVEDLLQRLLNGDQNYRPIT